MADTNDTSTPKSPANAPVEEVDERYGEEGAATSWAEASSALEQAELYWLSTVRADGRPHVTPLVGVWLDDAMHFCTGGHEQKAKNIAANPQCLFTTGRNTWADGLDMVVEGAAVRVTDDDRLHRIADTYRAKYGDAWDFGVSDGGFTHGAGPALVFEVKPAAVYAFGKSPHSHTRFRFAG